MVNPQDDPKKKQLEKLLQEYEANVGMAGFVCGRPVELLAEGEQKRIFRGFCTAGNIQILSASKEKLKRADELNPDHGELSKIEKAIPTLEKLIEVLNAYSSSQLKRDELRKEVRTLLHKPIPNDQEGLIRALSYLIDSIHFLSTQPVGEKDEWDRMVDCAQLHDALTRMQEVCTALQEVTSDKQNGSPRRSEAIDQTLSLAGEHREALESFFRSGLSSEEIEDELKSLHENMKELWGDGSGEDG